MRWLEWVFSAPTIPLSPWLSLLSVLIPIIYLDINSILRSLTNDRECSSILCPGITITWLILSIHIVSLISHSFAFGLPTAIISITIILTTVQRSIKGTESSFHSNEKQISNKLVVRKTLLAGFLWTVPMLPVLLFFDIHDRVAAIGHFSTMSQITNGFYPPRLIFFPDQAFRYHFGIDTLAASIAGILRLRQDIVYSILTLFFWNYIFHLSAFIGRRLWHEKTGIIAGSVVLLTGGIPLICEIANFNHSTIFTLAETCEINSFLTNPPLASYILQPPFSLGIPLLLCSFILISSYEHASFRSNYDSILWALVLGTFLLAISICHIVVFLIVLTSIAASVVLSRPRSNRSRDYLLLFLTVLVLYFATKLGGFFTPPSKSSSLSFPLGLTFKGYARNFFASVKWNIITFGILGALGFYEIYNNRKSLRNERTLFRVAFCTVVATIAVNIFYYKFSWDIIKFALISSVCLSIFAAKIMANISRYQRRFYSIMILIALCPALFWFQYWKNATNAALHGDLFNKWYQWRALPSADQNAIEFLRRHIQPTDLVYVREGIYLMYAIWGGLPEYRGSENGSGAHGILDTAIQHRLNLLRSPISINALIKEGVRYLVISPADHIIGLDNLEHAGLLQPQAVFGQLRIYDLTDVRASEQ